MRDDRSRVLDILAASESIRKWVTGLSYEQFVADRKTHAATCMELEIVGQAARTISDSFKRAHPEIPWRELAAMRHRIAHEYFRLDFPIIWEIVQRDVPDLIRLVEPIVPPDV